jgi:hypothetical protein
VTKPVFKHILKLYKKNNNKRSKITKKLGVVVHTYNPSNQEAEAGGSRVLGQPELHSETLSQKIKLKLNNKEVLSKDSRLNIQV